jgi:hypothetical protein
MTVATYSAKGNRLDRESANDAGPPNRDIFDFDTDAVRLEIRKEGASTVVRILCEAVIEGQVGRLKARIDAVVGGPSGVEGEVTP